MSTANSVKTHRIFLVDDHPIVREGLSAQLANQTDLQLCGSAEDLKEALTKIADTCPDLILVDISLKTSHGIDLVKRLKAKDESVRVLIWSMYPESLYAERALRAGAIGYVHKGRPADVILEAIRTTLAGKVYLSEEMSAKLLSRIVGQHENEIADSPIDELTDRELEAFALLGRGLTTLQIAEKMHVSPKTVETYRARIKEKLQLRNATELVHRAMQWVVEQE